MTRTPRKRHQPRRMTRQQLLAVYEAITGQQATPATAEWFALSSRSACTVRVRQAAKAHGVVLGFTVR